MVGFVGAPVLYGLEDVVFVVEAEVFEDEAWHLRPAPQPKVPNNNGVFGYFFRHFFAFHEIITISIFLYCSNII